jgi:hypothetical protein
MISTDRKLHYPMLLILSNPTKKTAESLAKTLNKSGDTVLRILEEECITWEELVSIAKKYFGSNKVKIIIDDSVIRKMYSKYIEGSGDNYDPVSKQVFRSLCTVVAMLTDGKIALPVLHKLWVKKELSSLGRYQTKVEIAQELIEQLSGKIESKIVLMDGLYATLDMIRWCNKRKLSFEMRFHSNRKVALDQNKPNVTVKISECKELLLSGKKSCRTIKALWHGEVVYITSVKRDRKNRSTIVVYQISNVEMLARNHVGQYNQRWYIEKFFRTAKQRLGLADCQARKKSLQENHIYNVFLAYAILQFQRKKNKLKNPEQALDKIKQKNNVPLSLHLMRIDQIFWNSEPTYA